MKTFKTLLVASVILVTLYSCMKTVDKYSPPQGGTFSYSFNGQTKTGFASAGYQNTTNTLWVTMSSAQGVYLPNLALSVNGGNNVVTAGTYQLSNSILSNYGQYTIDSLQHYLSIYGQLNISQIDIGKGTINGTFNFTGYNTLTNDSIFITNGTFTDGALVNFN